MMRTCRLMLFLAFCASAENERTFALSDTGNAAEIATIVRSIGDIKELDLNPDTRTIRVSHASAEQLALAGWLLEELDNASVANVPTPQGSPIAFREVNYPAGGDTSIVRVFYVTHTSDSSAFQEVATLVRSISQIRRVFTYNNRRAIAMLATPEQTRMAEWLLNRLDQEHPVSAEPLSVSDSVLQVFYLPPDTSIAEFQARARAMRQQTGIRSVFTYNTPRAIAVRGTTEQIAAAGRLLEH